MLNGRQTEIGQRVQADTTVWQPRTESARLRAMSVHPEGESSDVVLNNPPTRHPQCFASAAVVFGEILSIFVAFWPSRAPCGGSGALGSSGSSRAEASMFVSFTPASATLTAAPPAGCPLPTALAAALAAALGCQDDCASARGASTASARMHSSTGRHRNNISRHCTAAPSNEVTLLHNTARPPRGGVRTVHGAPCPCAQLLWIIITRAHALLLLVNRIENPDPLIIFGSAQSRLHLYSLCAAPSHLRPHFALPPARAHTLARASLSGTASASCSDQQPPPALSTVPFQR